MLVDEIGDESVEVSDLHRRYLTELARVIDAVGLDTVANATGIERERLTALPERDRSLTVAEATAILGCDDEYPDPDVMRQEVRDHLMLEMSSAVVDVDALSSALGGDFGPRDYQQMIEGRMPMPLREYARIYRYVEAKNPY